MKAAVTAAAPAAAMPTSQGQRAPEATSTPSDIATSTSAEPRSGWARTSRTGRPTSAPALRTSDGVGARLLSAAPARIIGRATQRATFASSEGWTEKPPGSSIHDRDPLIVDPTGVRTRTSAATDSP